jgi:hypothetical protein
MTNMYERDTVLNDLRHNVIEVTFTKVNGEDRIMRCTLMPNHLPPAYIEEDKQHEENFHVKNPDVIACWDVQNGGWRRFHISSIKYLQVIDGY